MMRFAVQAVESVTPQVRHGDKLDIVEYVKVVLFFYFCFFICFFR